MKTSPPSALPWRTRLAYGMGGVLDQWGQHGLKNQANIIFNLVLGISPATVGTVMALSRVWDALSDPLMGSVTDNARSRFGRRRPFILLGAMLCAFFSTQLWQIPVGLGANGEFWWLALTALLFYTTYTIFSVPYHALAYEIAPAHHQKTELLAVRMIFSTAASFAGGWIFALTQSGWLGTPRESARALGWIMGGILVLSGMIPAFFVKEPRLGVVAHQKKIPLAGALRRTLVSGPFVRLIGAAGLTIFGLNMINPLGTYVSVYYVFAGDAKAASILSGWMGIVYGVTVLIAAPLLVWFSRRIGKRDALLWCLALALVGTISKWWLYTPSHPWLQLVVNALLAPGMAGLWMLSESMVADISDYETLRSGERKEGMFSAVYGFVLKSGLAFGLLCSGWILTGSGFDVALGPAQSPEALWWLRLAFCGLPSAMLLAAIFLLLRFPLTAEIIAEARRARDSRDASSVPPAAPGDEGRGGV
ncbi:MAG TPA: MFS transporter [Candidatus Synoicihabitans sp.]|nr:MFS transporter [Candidatus Synoicihabitans sp.]